MANQEQVEILKRDVEEWNKRRWEWDIIDLFQTNLSDVNLRYANLSNADLRYTNLSDASLRGADLSVVNFIGANLTGADLLGANLKYSNLSDASLRYTTLNYVDLSRANLKKADFKHANLSDANLKYSNLDNANLVDTFLDSTIFAFQDLSTCKGLETVRVSNPCSIDFHTLKVSKNLPKSFLLKIGLPENYINYLPDFFDDTPLRLFPVFLSHSWANKDFAGKLYDTLIYKGVQVWYDEKKMRPGDDILESISKGIGLYDKTILVCSQESLESWWVKREMKNVFNKERNYQKENQSDAGLLIPITIDDYLYESKSGLATEIKSRVVGDFRNWQDPTVFEQKVQELIDALNVDRGDDVVQSFLK